MAKQYETVIGLEVHVELATKTKIFCGCSTAFGAAPNTHTCPVCTGMPGALPVLNKQVVEYAMAIGLAANCEITRMCRFDRKNYFYPDNPQNYQISQLYLPIARNGYVEIETGDTKKRVRIHEMHMEEDAGKLVHDEWDDTSLVDYNRSGVPLVEIVRAGYALCRGGHCIPGKAPPDHTVSGGLGLQAAGGLHACGCEPVRAGGGKHPVRNTHGDEKPELLQGHFPCH